MEQRSPFVDEPGWGRRCLHRWAGLEGGLRRLARRWLRGDPASTSGSSGVSGSRPPWKPTGAPIIFLPAVAWTYRFQRPQQLARALTQFGRPVLYVEAFARRFLEPPRWLSQEEPGLWRLELAVPGRPDPYRYVVEPRIAASMAELVAEVCRVPPGFILAQLPFWGPMATVLRQRLGGPLVYDRIDLHSGFSAIPGEVGEEEEQLLASADLVTASSRDLEDRSGRSSQSVQWLPNAVALDDFELRPWSARSSESPRVGYVGALGPWFDVPAVAHVARSRPQWSIDLAGRVEDPEVRRLDELPNLRLLGEIPYDRVPSFLQGLDAALIPFRDLPLTRAVDPVKLYEAMAVGLPVIARDLPELRRFEPPDVYCYGKPEELVRAVERALDEDRLHLIRSRRARVRQETWRRRAETLLARVESVHRPATEPTTETT